MGEFPFPYDFRRAPALGGLQVKPAPGGARTRAEPGEGLKTEKTNMRFRIRRGTARDIPAILKMIQGLAEYERLTHEVSATAARLRRHGFGSKPYFETLICTRGRTVVGFALYYFTYSTFLARPTLYVEDLYVLPEERGKGAGKILLSAMARVARGCGCGRMEWAVLDFNRPAIQFYKRIGAKLRKEWILTRLTGVQLRRLAQSR
jgi:GNAT superfamily N-acetyltransferase